ncbi:MAG: DnaJ domain-containing protein [Rhodospirillaceae bacterium]
MPKSEAPFSNDRSHRPPPRGCECPGCAAEGLYPAPKAKDRLREYFWFCLDHVREYNRAWDYYAGMSTAQIEAETRSDTIWQRPTWPLGNWRLRERNLRDSVNGEHGFPFGHAGSDPPPGRSGWQSVNRSPEDEAFHVLGLERDSDFPVIKARYRELAKRHHPDANGGDKVAEEKLKEINQAYTVLRAAYGR